jgi:3-mercaptopyruvate sulfurtransferase SseA
MGYKNLRVLDEGIPGWVEQGRPTEGWQAYGPFPKHPPGHGYAEAAAGESPPRF